MSQILLHKWLVMFSVDNEADQPVFVYARDADQAKSFASSETGRSVSDVVGIWNIEAQDWLRAPGCSLCKIEPDPEDQFRRAQGLSRMASDLARSYSNLAGGHTGLHEGSGPPPVPGAEQALQDDEAEELRKMVDNLNIRHHDFMRAQGYSCDHPMQWYTLKETLMNLIAQHKQKSAGGDKANTRNVLVFAFEEVLRIMNIGGSAQDYQTVVEEQRRETGEG